MHPWNWAAVGCLLVGGVSLCVGEAALAAARDLVSLYWLTTGVVSLRASFALVQK